MVVIYQDTIGPPILAIPSILSAFDGPHGSFGWKADTFVVLVLAPSEPYMRPRRLSKWTVEF